MSKLILFIAILMPFCGFGKITGRVFDAATKEPIVGASIYINNSTVGTTSNKDGYFEITQNVQPPFTLVISNIGFVSQSRQIEKQEVYLEILLKEQQTLLNEVQIVPGAKDPWEEYGHIFIKEFIGYSSFAKQCKILNPQVMSFYYDIDQNQLKAFSNAAIKIENKALGYLIDYWLDDFVIDYNSKSTFYKGYSFFTEQTPKNNKQREAWQNNRNLSYLGSLNHFLRSLYRNNIASAGFEMRTLIRFRGRDYGKFVPLWSDTITNDPLILEKQITAQFLKIDPQLTLLDSTVSLVKNYFAKDPQLPLKINIPVSNEESGQWFIFRKSMGEKMAVSFYDTLQKAPNPHKFTTNLIPNYDDYVYQVLYTDLVPIDSVRTFKNDTFTLAFNNFLMIRYKNETVEKEYAINERLKNGTMQESVISMRQPVTIFDNGNYQNTYDLFLEGYWSFEKLDKLLPIDYNTK